MYFYNFPYKTSTFVVTVVKFHSVSDEIPWIFMHELKDFKDVLISFETF